jgi:hypothetical protein
MAPQTLVAALVVGPDGSVKPDAGALHGRSELESGLELVQKRELVGEGKPFWIVWVAVELDQADKPLRYKGLSVCELFVNPEKRLGYKSLAEHVNRMSEAMRGGVNLTKLSAQERQKVKAQLAAIGAELWERSSMSLKQALES